MRTMTEGVQKRVLDTIRILFKPGRKFTRRMFKIAYEIEREDAKRWTTEWKRKNIKEELL